MADEAVTEKAETQYLVLRPFNWEHFTQADEFGNKVPVRVVLTGGETPQMWLPVFLDREEALACGEDGRYLVIMIRQSTMTDGRVPLGIPDICDRCLVVHWAPCPLLPDTEAPESAASESQG